MDEATLRELLDDVRDGRVDADDAVAAPAPPALRRPRLRPGRPPPGAAPGPGRGGLRPGQGTRTRWRPSSASCWRRRGGRPCSSPGSTTRRPTTALAANPGGHRHGDTLVWRPGARARRAHRGGHRRHRRPAGGRRVRGGARRPTASARCASPTSAWPGCTACSTRPTSWPRPTRWSSSPAWRARWSAWSAGSPGRRSIAVPTSTGYGASLEGRHRAAGHAGVVRRRASRSWASTTASARRARSPGSFPRAGRLDVRRRR